MATGSIKYIILLISTLAFINKLSAQQDIVLTEQIYGENYYHPQGLDGTPYLNDNWSKGYIILKNNKVATDIKMKFNVLTNDIVFYNENFKRLFTADKKAIQSVVIKNNENDSSVFMIFNGSYPSYKLQNNDFVEVLATGKNSLWVKHSAEISNSNDIGNRDKIYHKKYYFLNTQKGIYEIKLKTKQIVKKFPDHKTEIKKMAKANKLRNKSAKSMAKLVELINNEEYNNYK